MPDQNSIEISHLSKTYKGNLDPSVNDVSLIIKENEIYGLLGPNGAGKTAIISILCGIVKSDQGKVLLNGIDLANGNESIKKFIGVVPQDIALYPSLTAKENLAFYGAMYGIDKKTVNERATIWLEKLGLTKAANKKVESFSGGMKRRVNLIASLLHEPKILFLDEPTVGVDVQSRNVIIDLLKEINQNGTTIIYTSHHLEEAQDLCTQIAIIDYGRILAQGSPQELIENVEKATNLEDVFLHLTKRKLRD